MRLVIEGAPRTKKTSNRVLRFGRFNKIVPSAQYLAWRDSAVAQIKWSHPLLEQIARPVNVRARVYRDAMRGDLIGYLQGLADALQEAGVVADDKWIEGWDGSRLDKDAERPRIELEIQELTR